MKFDITHRLTGSVIFTAEIEADDDTPDSVKLGLSVKVAVKARANLDGANLAGANLARANLARANLDGANLAEANLAGANLAGANLDGANLDGANLAGANLARANLDGANLAEANLAGANLDGANLDGANLAGANLARANLARAKIGTDLDGSDITISKTPLQVATPDWPVIIFDAHMKIGCEFHSISDWFGFDDRRIALMDGVRALRFWRVWRDALRAVATAGGRDIGDAADAVQEAAE